MKELKQEFDRIVAEDGPWSAHNIKLGEDFYTLGPEIVNDEYKLRRVVQNIRDLAKKDFSELRILDLACLEGLYGLECALQGAEVTFLDAREPNLRKVDFAAKALGLKNYNIVRSDVRDISPEELGMYDVVLCFGIFYHLDKSDLAGFVKKMYSIATDFVYLDTHITANSREKFNAYGVEYFGEGYREHRKGLSEEQMKADLWKSYGNEFSFKLTRSSLVRMLQQAGFTSVFESYLPHDRTKDFTRVSIFGIKGKGNEIKVFPKVDAVNDLAEEITPEKIAAEKRLQRKNNFRYFLHMNLPEPVKKVIKKVLGR
jgi:hypothetical protein